jgi:hypothetical protein
MANDSVRVTRILDEGALDPDVILHPEDLSQGTTISSFDKICAKKVFRQSSSGCGPTALHVAVVSFFDHVDQIQVASPLGPADNGWAAHCALSLDIIRQLLEFGADPSATIRNMSYVFRETRYNCESKTTPIRLAEHLKELVCTPDLTGSRRIWSNRLIELLRMVNRDSTETVLQPVEKMYERMLFSEKFSDIKIICGDEVIIHAHKIVLAESSEYFSSAFDGPWTVTESGEWTTSHPSHVMKVVLTLLYTGKLDKRLVDECPLDFVSVAAEYGIASLNALAESSCVGLVNETNVCFMLQAAHLYNSSAIRNACAEYVKGNALAVLRNTEIMILKTENPDAWDELWTAIDLLHPVNGEAQNVTDSSVQHRERLVAF